MQNLTSKEELKFKQQDVIQDKTIIHLNKGLGNIQTNKNCEIIYNLLDNIQLRKGDSVVLSNAMLNVRGQNSTTINIPQDISHTLKFMHFIPDNPNIGSSFGNQQVFNVQRSHEYTACPSNSWEGYQFTTAIEDLGSGNFGQSVLSDADYSILNEKYTKPNGSPMLMGTCSPLQEKDQNNNLIDQGTKRQINFSFREKTINIKAGNYDVNSLADLITDQINGTANVNQNFLYTQPPVPRDQLNFVDDKILVLNEFIHKKPELLTSFQGSEIPTASGAKKFKDKITSRDYVFWDLSTFNRIRDKCELYYNNPNDPSLKTDGIFNMMELIDTKEFELTSTNPEVDGVLFAKIKLEKLLPTVIPDIREYYDYCLKARSQTECRFKDSSRDSYPSSVDPQTMYEKPLNYGGKTSGSEVSLDVGGIISLAQNNDGTNGQDISPKLQDNEDFGLCWNASPVSDGRKNLNIVDKQRIIGTKSLQFSFGSDKQNRFALSGLHEPYRINTIQQNRLATQPPLPVNENIGQNCTNIIISGRSTANRYPLFNILKTDPRPIGDNDNYVDINQLKYNIEATSGIVMLSFDSEAIKNTKKYKNLLEKQNNVTTQQEYNAIDFLLNCMPHDWYFTNSELDESWDKSLWNQMGFVKSDLGEISKQEQKYFTSESIRQAIVGNTLNVDAFSCGGLITHNTASLGLNTGLSGMSDPLYFNPAQGSAIPLQRFDTVGLMGSLPSVPISKNFFYFQTEGPVKPAKDLGLPDAYNPATVTMGFSQIPILTDYLYFNASSYPNLSANQSYFIIESDIVFNNYLDAKSSKKTMVALCNRENSTADTIFSVDPIQFIMKEDKLLSTITINVTNPDGTDVSNEILENASGFIFEITRNLNLLS